MNATLPRRCFFNAPIIDKETPHLLNSLSTEVVRTLKLYAKEDEVETGREESIADIDMRDTFPILLESSTTVSRAVKNGVVDSA